MLEERVGVRCSMLGLDEANDAGEESIGLCFSYGKGRETYEVIKMFSRAEGQLGRIRHDIRSATLVSTDCRV